MAPLLFVLTGILSASFVLSAEKIDINAAPVEDLVKIIHIGESRARELISLRPFASLDSLAKIKGISEKRVEDIKKQGLASVDAQEKPETETASTKSEEEALKNEAAYPLSLEKELTAVGNSFVLLIAIPLAVFSGIIILILKKNKVK